MAKITPRPPKKNLTVMPGTEQAPPATAEPAAAAVQAPPPPTQVNEVEPVKGPGRPSRDGLNFFQRLGSYAPEEWEGGRLIIYVYRIQPFTDRLAGGDKNVFAMKYSGVIDEMNLLKDLGSGRYHLKLNRSMDGTGNTKPVDTSTLDLLNTSFPPNVPAGEWVDDPRNKKWAWAAPKGSAIHAERHAADAAANPVQNAAEMVQTIFDVAERINEHKEEPKPPAPPPPPDPLTQMKGMAEILKDIAPKPAKDEGSPILLLISEQLKSLREQNEREKDRTHLLEKELRDRASAPPPRDEFMEQLKAKAFAKLLDDPKPAAEIVEPSGGGGHRTTVLDIVKDVGVELARSPVIANLSQALLVYLMRPPAPQPAHPAALPAPAAQPQQQYHPQPYQPQQPAAPQQPYQPAQAPPPTQAAPQPQPAAPPQQVPQGMEEMKIPPQMLAGFVGQVIQPLMAHFTKGLDGHDLAQWVIDSRITGQTDYLFIKNQGVDNLMMAFKLSPFWNPGDGNPGLVQLEPQLRTMLEEFCEGPGQEEGDEDEDAEDGDEPEDLTEEE